MTTYSVIRFFSLADRRIFSVDETDKKPNKLRKHTLLYFNSY